MSDNSIATVDDRLSAADQIALVTKYRVPDELVPFIDDGFLVPLSENWDDKCLKFHLPTKIVVNTRGRFTSYTVFWIHPDFNAECCDFYDEQPGDQPNFYVVEEITDVGDQYIENLDTLDDLVDWLASMKWADLR